MTGTVMISKESESKNLKKILRRPLRDYQARKSFYHLTFFLNFIRAVIRNNIKRMYVLFIFCQVAIEDTI